MNRPADDPLLGQFLNRAPDALILVERAVTIVVQYRGYGIPAAEQAELVQEAMLQIWREAHSEKFAFRENFRAFARMVALRRCLSWRRRLRPETPLEPYHLEITNGADNPEKMAERRQLASRILNGLRSTCRELLMLHILEGRSYTELSDRLKRSEPALRTAVWQCLKEARSILRETEGGPRRGDAAWSAR